MVGEEKSAAAVTGDLPKTAGAAIVPVRAAEKVTTATENTDRNHKTSHERVGRCRFGEYNCARQHRQGKHSREGHVTWDRPCLK